MSWYLKKQDGSVFGPADLTTIREWAASGRVAPEDDISRDREDWKPAADEPLLEMHWLIELPDGETYGPVHLLAIRDLLLEQSVLPQTILHNTATHERCKLAEALMPHLIGEYHQQREQLQAFRDMLQAGEAADVQPDDQGAGWQAGRDAPAEDMNWQQTFREQDRLEKAVQKWKQLYEEERGTGQQRESAANERLRALNQENIAIQTTLEQTRRELDQLRKAHEAFETARSSGDAMEGLWKMYLELSHSYETLSHQFTGKVEEIRAVREAMEHLRADTESRIRQLEQQVDREKDLALRANRQLAELEGTHLQIIKAFREMNDNYIRMRDKLSSTDQAPQGSAVVQHPGNVDGGAPPPRHGGPRIKLRR